MKNETNDITEGLLLVAETVETSSTKTDAKLDQIKAALNKQQPIIKYSAVCEPPAVNKPTPDQPANQTPNKETPATTPDQPAPASNPTNTKPNKIVREKGGPTSFRSEAMNFVKETFATMSGAVTNQIDKLGSEIVPGYSEMKEVGTKIVKGTGSLAKSAFERMRSGSDDKTEEPISSKSKIIPSSRTDKPNNETKKQTKLLASIDKSLKRPQKGTKGPNTSNSLGDMARMFLPMTMLIGTMVTGVLGLMGGMASGALGLITTMTAGVTGLITTMAAGIATAMGKLTNPFKKTPLPSSTKNPTTKGSAEPSGKGKDPNGKGKPSSKPSSTANPNAKPSAKPTSVTNTSKLERVSNVSNVSNTSKIATTVEAAESAGAKQAGKFGLGTAVKTGAKRVAGAGMNAGAAALGMGSKAIPVVGQFVMLAQSIDMLVEAITGKAWLSKENLDTVDKVQNGGLERGKPGDKMIPQSASDSLMGDKMAADFLDNEQNRKLVEERNERKEAAARAMAASQHIQTNANVSNSTNNTFLGNSAMSQRSVAERRGSTHF
ncbi:hypothetical protein [Aeromonas rivipollensis]|uniref:hypothetical protein n=1 Tax=Aeromonas rivipollensis TaxID=948519 RepID=UPI003D1FA844